MFVKILIMLFTLCCPNQHFMLCAFVTYSNKLLLLLGYVGIQVV